MPELYHYNVHYCVFELCACHVHLRQWSGGPCIIIGIGLIQNGQVNCSSSGNSRGKDIGDAIECICQSVQM